MEQYHACFQSCRNFLSHVILSISGNTSDITRKKPDNWDFLQHKGQNFRVGQNFTLLRDFVVSYFSGQLASMKAKNSRIMFTLPPQRYLKSHSQ